MICCFALEFGRVCWKAGTSPTSTPPWRRRFPMRSRSSRASARCSGVISIAAPPPLRHAFSPLPDLPAAPPPLRHISSTRGWRDRTRSRSTSTTAPNIWNRHWPPSAAGSSRSTPITGTARTNWRTCGRTARSLVSCSTAASPPRSRRCARASPGSASGCGSMTAPAHAPPGPRPTRRRRRSPPRPAGAPGQFRATISCCSILAAPPACPRE